MYKITKFKHIRFGEVRITAINNSIMFIANDIAKALRYGQPELAVSQHCKNIIEKLIPELSKEQKTLLISELDVHRLAYYSNSFETKRFQDWIFTCIQSIRYSTEKKQMKGIDKILSNPERIMKLTTDLKKEKRKRMAAESANKKNSSKILFASSLQASHNSILIGELAKILQQNGIKTGQNKLFKWLRTNHYLCKSGERYNSPSQKAMSMGLFEIKKTAISRSDGNTLVITTPKITSKGQSYFIRKFLNKPQLLQA